MVQELSLFFIIWDPIWKLKLSVPSLLCHHCHISLVSVSVAVSISSSREIIVANQWCHSVFTQIPDIYIFDRKSIKSPHRLVQMETNLHRSCVTICLSSTFILQLISVLIFQSKCPGQDRTGQDRAGSVKTYFFCLFSPLSLSGPDWRKCLFNNFRLQTSLVNYNFISMTILWYWYYFYLHKYL